MIGGGQPIPVQTGQTAYHAFDYRKAVNSFNLYRHTESRPGATALRNVLQ
jgi:hypothetical protein